MKLIIHSDASYLSKPKARSRAGDHFFLTKKHNDTHPDNGRVVNVTQIINAVMSLAAEAELGGIYLNAKFSVISTEGAEFCSVDIKNFYLCTPLKCNKYVQMHLADFPEDVIKHYKFKELANKEGMVFVEI